MSVFIIAEIGINHNGDLNIAKKLIVEKSFTPLEMYTNKIVGAPKEDNAVTIEITAKK